MIIRVGMAFGTGTAARHSRSSEFEKDVVQVRLKGTHIPSSWNRMW